MPEYGMRWQRYFVLCVQIGKSLNFESMLYAYERGPRPNRYACI